MADAGMLVAAGIASTLYLLEQVRSSNISSRSICKI